MIMHISRNRAVVALLTVALLGGGVSAVAPAVASEDSASYAAGTNWQKVWKKQLKPLTDRRYYSKHTTNKKFATKHDLGVEVGALRRNVYTKAESNAALGNYYTKAQSDAGYASKSQTYTTAEIDGKLAPFTNSVASFAGGKQTVTLTPAEQIVRSVSLMPPANGTVVVSSNAWIQRTSVGLSASRCSLTDGSVIDEEFRQVARVSSTSDSEAIAGTRGFPVTQGNLLTVNLACETFTGTSNLWDSSMTAIFAPS